MKIARLIHALLLATACLSLTSCDSEKPISDPEKAKADPTLAGLWCVRKDDKSVGYFHVGPAGGKLPAGVQRMILINYKNDGTLERPVELFLISSEIGKNKYLSMAVVDKDKIEKVETTGWNADLVIGYLLLKYQVEGDKLTLWGLTDDEKRQAIQAGKIQGRVGKDNAYFTDTSENLAMFLASPDGAGLFSKKPDVFERVK